MSNNKKKPGFTVPSDRVIKRCMEDPWYNLYKVPQFKHEKNLNLPDWIEYDKRLKSDLTFLRDIYLAHRFCSVDGFFGDSSLGVINMFKWAMKEMNMDSTIHPGMPIANFMTQLLPNDDAFEAGKQG